MMEEKNRQTLEQALRQLPDYSPSDRVWAEMPLRDAIGRLPDYEPSDRVWEAIQPRMRPRRRRILPWLAAGAAAVILFLINLPHRSRELPADQVAVSHRVEVVDNLLLQRPEKLEEDEEAFAYLEAVCQEKPFVCANPDIHSLRNELEELNAAKAELEAVLGEYGADPYLQEQLTEIEWMRTRLLQQMLERFL